MRAFLVTLAVSFTGAGVAQADAEPISVFVVGHGPTQKAATGSNISARVGEKVSLFVVVKRGRGRKARYYTDAPRLRLGRRISRRAVRPFAKLGARVQWSQVEPRQFHVDTESPNAGNPAYSNSVLFGPKHGKWLGFDRLEYIETPIAGATRGALTVKRASPTDRRLKWARGAGTMRYKATITLGGVTHASLGADKVTRGGIAEDVMRVSFRRRDGFTGHLTSYFNVPNVFGSAGKGRTHQTDRFQGADCADVIVGAARRAGAQIDYTHAAGLTRYARPVTGLLKMGRSDVTYLDGAKTGQTASLRWGRDVKEGDIVLIDYSNFAGSKRKWDHVGVLAFDAKGGELGVLDPKDALWHIGFKTGLREEALSGQGRATIQVLRFKRSVARRFRR